MADALEEEEEVEAPKGPSLVVVLLLVIVLTLVAGGAGGGLGLFLAPSMQAPTESAEKTDEKAEEAAPEYSSGQTLKTLAPIVTNLAKPKQVFVRLESSVIFSKTPETDPAELTAKLTNDFLNFLRTLSLDRIGGPSGILHLKTDLNEIAKIRSDGMIEEVIITSLVVE